MGVTADPGGSAVGEAQLFSRKCGAEVKSGPKIRSEGAQVDGSSSWPQYTLHGVEA